MAFAHSNQDRLWPEGIVPYDIATGDFESDQTEVIDRAIRHWNERTIMRLIPALGHVDRVVFRAANESCSSRIGRVGGEQTIGCDVGDGFGMGSVVHEIGHAIGLYHEHTRPDRELSVEIRWENIRGCPDGASDIDDCGGCADDPGGCGCTSAQVADDNCEKQHNFRLQTNGKVLTEYDFGSIMHYGRAGFSKPGHGDTVVPLGGEEIGQRNGLSTLDVRGVCAHYGAPHFVVTWKDALVAGEPEQLRCAAMARWGKRCGAEVTLTDRSLPPTSPAAVATSDQGLSVVAWHEGSVGARRVRAIGLEHEGATRFAAIEVSVADASAADLAADADGRFVVVWQDVTDRQRVRARGFDEFGVARTAEIVVAERIGATPGAAAVSMAPNGRFVVAWGELRDDSLSVHAAVFDEDGTIAVPDFEVAADLGDQDVWPRVAMLPSAEFVVTWERSVDDVMARGFRADGAEHFAERRVNSRATGQQFLSDVAVRPDNTFLITWTDDANDNFLGQIRGVGLGVDGEIVFAERTMNTRGGGDQRSARVAVGTGGLLYVVWQDDEDRNDVYQVKVEVFDGQLERLLTSHTVNEDWPGQQWAPSVASA